MLGRSLLGAGVHRRLARLFTSSLAIAGVGAFGGCLSRPIAPVDPNTSTTVVEKLRESAVDKIDLLLVVDNSASMADKQKILAVAIPDLLGPLVNPPCLDSSGAPTATQPAGPLEACPAGSDREFPPVLDIHIGVITSSLGTYGAGGCDFGAGTDNDHGHLISRVDANDPTGAQVPTYDGLGFLAWDPKGQLSPKGESDYMKLTQDVHDLVVGAGQNGCGYESQNEAWYRFLVDPSPPAGFAKGLPVTPQGGIDQALLDQRKAFLRPDSLLAIINVTDETDTSIKGYSYYPIIADGQQLPEPRSECASAGPADHCCDSCGDTNPPKDCPSPDPVCKATPVYPASQDNVELHAFGLVSHKQRFGVDFFYPVSRYVQALTSKTVPDVNGKMVPNPIFSVLDPSVKSNGVRDPSLVFYAAITGVPWQLIARQNKGQPDLGLGFKSSSELDLKDAAGHTFWDDIAGDPDTYRMPASPFMEEALSQRTGKDPITGVDVAAANPINGGERPIHAPAGDIEYACTFPILDPIDCSSPSAECDCKTPNGVSTFDDPSKNPLCAPNPADVDPSTGKPRYTLQVAAKAYPGLRNLAIAHGLGEQGIAASICAKTVAAADQASPEYGYRPAVNAIVDRLKVAIGGQCLPTQVTPDASGSVSSCLVLEARDTGGQACTCTAAARQPVSPEHQSAVTVAQQQETSTAGDCFCEIPETQGAALTSCLEDKVTSNADGWCYVDDTHGNAALLDHCPATEKRLIRLVGAGKQALGSTLFITCEHDH